MMGAWWHDLTVIYIGICSTYMLPYIYTVTCKVCVGVGLGGGEKTHLLIGVRPLVHGLLNAIILLA